ncbi:dihydrofolate reductase family protein [Actinomadura sp. NTSP31]|uniref:dihydrofolate reductase family protein n=1 Tax=Actinomadura sp. NTSP31 TaxID=1735447 RepID=UPI0035BF6364
MGKVIVSTQMTVDGVIDRIDEWFTPAGEHEDSGSFDQLFAADALLLGRKTYEGLASVWPTITDTRGFADRVNGMPKFVISRTLRGPLEWNASLVEGTPAEAISELKQRYTGNLVSYGCGELAHHLATQGLVDEIRFWVHPVVLGHGTRPFHSLEPPVHMTLTGSTTYRSGVTLLSYRPKPE